MAATRPYSPAWAASVKPKTMAAANLDLAMPDGDDTASGADNIKDGLRHVSTHRETEKKEPIFFCMHLFKYLTETDEFFLHTLGLREVDR